MSGVRSDDLMHDLAWREFDRLKSFAMIAHGRRIGEAAHLAPGDTHEFVR
jgi:hypothetical protein